jgi:tRNA threonylcarbamoyladenosine biosynthesis protein TsaE
LEFQNPIIVNSEIETAKLAEQFSSKLKGGEVIVLNGNLGAGKTFFIKNLLNKFGIDNTTSPSFAIVNEYSGKFKIYHFDFYRIEKITELYDIGFNDYLNDPDAITFIEWGNLFQEILPAKRIDIEILIKENSKREIYINYHE